jgi:hypothetical protein
MADEEVHLPDREGRRSRGARFLWKTRDVDVSEGPDTADEKTAKGEDEDENDKT